MNVDRPAARPFTYVAIGVLGLAAARRGAHSAGRGPHADHGR